MSDVQVFISHSSHLPGARNARLKLEGRLKDAGFGVLVDHRELELGDQWRRKVFNMAFECHAAVAVLSKAALTSPYVLLEIAWLTARRYLDDGFIVIPVLLPPVSLDHLGQGPLRPMQLEDLQQGQMSNKLLKRIIDRFTPLKTALAPSPLEDLRTRIALWLPERQDRIKDIADHLRIPIRGLTPEQSRRRIARALIDSDLTSLPKTFEALAPNLSDRTAAHRLLAVLACCWVDPEAIAPIPAVMRRPCEERAVALNCTKDLTATAYLQRARARFPSCAIVPVTRSALGSAWAQREVTILMWRMSLRPDFLVLPVLARDLPVRDVAASPLAATGLTDLDFLVEAEPEQTVARVSEAMQRFHADWRKPVARPDAAPSAPVWTPHLDCPDAVAAGAAFTVVARVTPESEEDLPVLAAVPQDAEIRVDVVADGTLRDARAARGIEALAQDPFRMSFPAPQDPDRIVVVRATFSSRGQTLAAVDRRIRVVDAASADRPAVYRDETGERRLVVLDRFALRNAMHQLADPASQTRILVVNGPAGSGKSFTFQIIRLFSEETQAFQTAYVDVARLPVPGPVDLARELVLRVGGSVGSIPGLPGSTARGVREMASWLVEQAQASDRDWWWILDGLSSPELPEVTRDLVRALASEVQHASLRLVLLDFDEPLPSGLSPFVFQETLAPIGEPEVRESLSDLLRRQGRRVEEAEIGAAARSALEGLPVGAHRLGALSARVSRLVEAMTLA